MNEPKNMALPAWKRVLDRAFIIVSLPFLVPLGLLIVVLIKRKSAGPVLFQQKRLGYQGRPFMILKFRTMHCGAETVSHQGHLQQLINSDAPMTKLDATGDSRIIPFGKILRSSGLDELPQLVNVWKGEMSLVGPRPCVPYEAEKFLPWQKERFNAAPGLTGLWQVNGKNRTTFTRMMELDIEYSRRKSLGLDLLIILRTPYALLVQMWDSRQKKKAQNCVVTAPPAMSVRHQ